MRKHRHRWWRCGVAAAVLLVGNGHRSAAQDPHFWAIRLVPDTIRLSDATPMAPFTLTNRTTEPLDVDLMPECPASSYLVLPIDLIAAAWRNQSSCALPWLSGYPRHVVLAANESRTLSMRVIPPPTLPDGHYTARLIWSATVSTNALPSPDTGSYGMLLMSGHYELAVTYTKGPQPPRRARTQWRATPPAKRAGVGVSHTPAVLVLDDSTRTTTFTLHNPGATPTEVWLAVDCPWFQVNFSKYPLSSQDESGYHGRIPTFAAGLGDYPQHLVLAPHERRTISIPVIGIEDDLPSGSYYARVVYVQSPILSVTSGGDTAYATPQGEIDVVYHKGAAPPRLSLSQLHATRQPDGTVHACVTVEQPGMGVLVTLHAEVDDARGHPVRAHVSTRSAGGGHPLAWGVDTTVTVWNVVHNNPMDQFKDGRPKPPDPICFALPNFAPGHYQLVVSVSDLEDVAKHHLVQSRVPLEIP